MNRSPMKTNCAELGTHQWVSQVHDDGNGRQACKVKHARLGLKSFA
jgi:hypothetical protein